MTKYEFLRIQHRINSLFANTNYETEQALNKINADLYNFIHLFEKKQLQLVEELELIKGKKLQEMKLNGKKIRFG